MKMIKQMILKTYLVIIFLATLIAGNCSGMLDIPDPNGPKGPGITVNAPGSGYVVSEFNGVLNLTAVLNTKPTADVTIPVNSSSIQNATVSTPSLTFTPSNWNTPQSITITGVDNFIIDGNRNINLVFGSAVSGDQDYNGGIKPAVPVIVTDNESYSIVVSPTNLTTTEAAGPSHSATFYVALSTAPASGHTVTIPAITSQNTGEGTVSPSSLAFDSTNWNTPQAVTVTGVDDLVEDGNKTYNISLGSSAGSEPGYNGLPLDTVVVTNIDAQASIPVTPTTLNLVEALPADCTSGTWGNCSGTFTVALKTLPTANVVIGVSTGGNTRATVDKASLTFTSVNGTTPQTVTVTTVDDAITNPVTPVTIILSADTTTTDLTYKNKKPSDVTVNIEDDEGYGIRVSNLSRVTTEATPPSTTNGQNATFQVKLNKQPAAGTTVTIPINDTYDIKNYLHSEGYVDKSTLTFTDLNWNVPQVVTVTPVNDFIKDGDVQYVIGLNKVSSADPNYTGKKPRDVTVINMNKDIAGFHVETNGSTAISDMTTGNQTFSGFVTDDMNNLTTLNPSFSIKLRSKPVSNVTLNFASASATNDGILSSSSLTFTPANWNALQTVTVSGGSNGVNEGNHTYLVNTSITTTDSVYSTIGRPSFNINSCDDDVNNLIVDCMFSGGNMTTTSESGSTASFWLITKSAPASNIVVGLTSNDLTEGTVPASITITSANYNKLTAAAANQVIVTGVDDLILDGTINYTITPATSSGGLVYSIPGTYALQNLDNEVRYVTSVTGNTTETPIGQTINGVAGATATINVTLGNSVVWTSDVTMAVACVDTTECSGVVPNTLTFNAGNFNTTQQVVVTGSDDAIADGNVSSNVSFTVTSADPIFSGQNFNVAVTNVDNENPAKTIYVTAATFVGDMTASGVLGADGFCNGSDANKPATGTFKAMMVTDGITANKRIATTTGTDATGQLNWVLLPNTQYYLSPVVINDNLALSSHLFTTDANSLFAFPLTHAFSANGADTFWTGMNANLTTVANTVIGNNTYNNCDNWTINNNPVSPFYDYYGQFGIGNSLTSSSISSNTGACGPAISPNPANGSVQRKLICVQQ